MLADVAFISVAAEDNVCSAGLARMRGSQHNRSHHGISPIRETPLYAVVQPVSIFARSLGCRGASRLSWLFQIAMLLEVLDQDLLDE
jgi:hypothetical protein